MIRYTWLEMVVELPEKFEDTFWRRVNEERQSLQDAMVATLTEFYNDDPEEYKRLYGKFNPQTDETI